MRTIDLNCDLAESADAADVELMRVITSANVACGYHAGSPSLMRQAVRLARACGVAVGAHPGLPDRDGFGRQETLVRAADAEDMLLYQLGALSAVAAAEGVGLSHVKPHGALYNMAVRDRPLADAIARAVKTFNPALVLFGLAGSELLRAGASVGLRTAAEGFADRAYQPDGSLVRRSESGAVIHDADLVVHRAIRMVVDGTVAAADGSELPIAIDTICIHGDTPGAADLARAIRAGLTQAGVRLQRPANGAS